MNVLAIAAASALVAAQPDLPPIPDINVALVFDDREVAADTTDIEGRANLPVQELGEQAVALQEPLPVEAVLIVVLGEDEEDQFSTPVSPGVALGPLISFPAEPGEIAAIRIFAADPSWAPEEAPVDPVESRAEPPLEHTHQDATETLEERLGEGGDAP